MSFDLTLTFDNGPEPTVTPGVLAVLAECNIKSTFFTVGLKVQDHPELLKQITSGGHWIGNHTWSHSGPLGHMHDARREVLEITSAQSQLGPLGNVKRLFRPVGGGGELGPHLLTPASLRALLDGQYTCVLWNSIPGDWHDPYGWVDRALAHCSAQPWTLMVLHDLPNGAMDLLPEFLQRARAQGARFRQDFPPECLPIVAGVPMYPLETLTTED